MLISEVILFFQIMNLLKILQTIIFKFHVLLRKTIC